MSRWFQRPETFDAACREACCDKRRDHCRSLRRIGLLAVWTVAASFATASLSGCEKLMNDMYDQPRYKPLAASPLWPDGASARPIEPGTVVHSAGAIAATSSGREQVVALPGSTAEPLLDPAGHARGASAAPVDERGQSKIAAAISPDQPARFQNPLPLTLTTLHRGRERFDIYCAPCHSAVGDGDGLIVRRGFPRPQSFHVDRLRSAPDEYFYAIVTNGYGAMYPYADRVEPQDRWAIVAYVRALQLSRNATLADAPANEREKLEAVR